MIRDIVRTAGTRAATVFKAIAGKTGMSDKGVLEMSRIRMINVDSLPNIPWQERPADLKTESPVWRYT